MARLTIHGSMMPLFLTVWSDTVKANVREVGPFPSLQAAFDAVKTLEDSCEAGECVLLTGTDETNTEFDAYEPAPAECAAEYRAEAARDEAEYHAMASSEARRMAGMAHGNRGLADYGGAA